ncbi:hypothetical protein Tsubulata_015411 [Turnera subulata]|uniref:RING-type domain-containing protein n=1 Tax=Turnera subulata TaxID=218843 RepID=A0A9Q0FYV7_9ROSI|nr:hypothetical protein Tsubulata_015411 [Turnera subulata]
MTSASELFYQRRSRVGRTDPFSADHLGLEPSISDRSFHPNYNRRHHHNNNHHGNRHDLDGCDPVGRTPHRRHNSHRLSSSLLDRPPIRLDQATEQFIATNNNNVNSETVSRGSASRPRLIGNERLPGAVLLARARLVERLRGVSLSGNRQSGRASFGTSNRESMLYDDLRVVDAADWRAWWSAESSPSVDPTFMIDRQEIAPASYKKKPPGLTQAALDCLHHEVFSSLKVGNEGEGSWDCSICLETFADGDELICLPCEHRFHSACLDPWVRTCGDCPYCRRDILVSSYKL